MSQGHWNGVKRMLWWNLSCIEFLSHFDTFVWLISCQFLKSGLHPLKRWVKFKTILFYFTKIYSKTREKQFAKQKVLKFINEMKQMLLFLLTSFGGFLVSLDRGLVSVPDVSSVLADDVPDRFDGGFSLVEDLEGWTTKFYDTFTLYCWIGLLDCSIQIAIQFGGLDCDWQSKVIIGF